jgi:hypothetical protein
MTMLGTAPDAAEAETTPPSPWKVFGEPRETFDQLAAAPRPRRALRWLLFTLPLLPIVIAVGSYGGIHDTLADDPELSSRTFAAPFISALAGIVVLGLQIVMLGAHLALFVALVRWMRTPRERRAVVAVWAYAMFPLILRQAFFILLLVVQGPDWFRDHGALVSVLDPFIIMIGVLFWFGCRRVLELDRRRSLAVALLVSAVGMLGGLGAALT